MVTINPEYIAFFGLFIGVLTRIYLPYLRKLYQGSTTNFDNKYIVSGLAALALAFIIVFMLGPECLVLVETTLLKVFWLNWIVGFGASALVNEVLAWGAPREGS